MIISILGNWDKAKAFHTVFLEKKINTYQKKFSNNATKHNYIDIKVNEFITIISPLVIESSKNDLLNSICIYNEFVNTLDASDVPAFKKKIKYIFNYDSFIKKNGVWNAYELCKLSITKTCPYCNQAYAFTYQKYSKGFRPTLDHFYSKDNYPHLALSLNNLIPSCNTCNSTLKGTVDFYKNKHLHPLWDKENLTFRLLDKRNDTHTGNQVNYSSETHHLDITLEDYSCTSSKNSLETFMLNERYEFLINEAIDFANLKQLYDITKGAGIKHFNELSEESILRFDKNNYQKYLLGKLFRDLYH
mgnify:CR=1 FL=1